MEILKDKKILIGVGVLVALGVAYYAMKKKNEVGSTSTDSVALKDNYAVRNNGSIYQVIGGKKYGFSNYENYLAYGKPDFEEITKAELDAIPDGGFIGDGGKVVKQ